MVPINRQLLNSDGVLFWRNLYFWQLYLVKQLMADKKVSLVGMHLKTTLLSSEIVELAQDIGGEGF